MKKNSVSYEFAPLKRVVLAQSEFHSPRSDKQESYDTDFLLDENAALFFEKFGDLKDLYPELQQKWLQEKENMKVLLEKYDVEIMQPRLMTTVEKNIGIESGYGYGNFFTRDPFFTVGSLIIEGNLRFPHRALEILPIREILMKESKNPDVVYLGTPRPDISEGDSREIGPFLEGGDVLVYGKTIYVGYSGLASNLKGIEWLTELLKNWDYKVVPVRLHPNILHLDCAMSMIRDGLMIYCEEAFLDGLPTELTDWDKIHITLEEAAQLMANGLPINDTVYVTDESFTTLIPKIESYGITVETIDYAVSRMFGGSFRCTTQALLRTY